uniref:POU class 6 homeobox 1 n=1 Tax=Ailuropoda melanoleuca TaxID=9646 RepID=A0A7N5K5A7_AILME
MDPGAGPESSLTVNEQVIVMSGHETIRVLEVGVDAQISAEEEGKGLEGVAAERSQSRGPGEASEPAGEAGPDNPDSSAEATVKSLPGIPPSPAPALATFSQAPSQPQASQTLTPLAVQAAPQVRATRGAEQRVPGRSKAWDSQCGVAVGSGNFTGRTGKGLWHGGGNPLLGTPWPLPYPRSGPLGKLDTCLPSHICGSREDCREG